VFFPIPGLRPKKLVLEREGNQRNLQYAAWLLTAYGSSSVVEVVRATTSGKGLRKMDIGSDKCLKKYDLYPTNTKNGWESSPFPAFRNAFFPINASHPQWPPNYAVLISLPPPSSPQFAAPVSFKSPATAAAHSRPSPPPTDHAPTQRRSRTSASSRGH
jgi:hypothetical protein